MTSRMVSEADRSISGRSPVIFLIVLVLSSASTLPAQQVLTPPNPREILRRAAESFRSMQSVSFDISTGMRMKNPGRERQIFDSQSVSILRPNKFSIIPTEGSQTWTAVCDGENLYNYNPGTQEYSVQPAPESFDDYSDPEGSAGFRRSGMTHNMGAMMLFLVLQDDVQLLRKSGGRLQHVGREVVGGVECDHIELKLGLDRFGSEMGVWISTGDSPLVMKIVPDVEQWFEGVDAEMNVELSITTANWKINGEIADEVFEFTPPPGSRRIDSITRARPAE